MPTRHKRDGKEWEGTRKVGSQGQPGYCDDDCRDVDTCTMRPIKTEMPEKFDQNRRCTFFR